MGIREQIWKSKLPVKPLTCDDLGDIIKELSGQVVDKPVVVIMGEIGKSLYVEACLKRGIRLYDIAQTITSNFDGTYTIEVK